MRWLPGVQRVGLRVPGVGGGAPAPPPNSVTGGLGRVDLNLMVLLFIPSPPVT